MQLFRWFVFHGQNFVLKHLVSLSKMGQVIVNGSSHDHIYYLQGKILRFITASGERFRLARFFIKPPYFLLYVINLCKIWYVNTRICFLTIKISKYM